MPITRRRRANQPDQPEQNNHLADHLEHATEALATDHSAEFSQPVERQELHQDQLVQQQHGQPGTPQAQFHSMTSPTSPSSSVPQASQMPPFSPGPQASQAVSINQVPPTPVMNGERMDRQDYASPS